MNWIETLDEEIDGWAADIGKHPKEIQISDDDWLDFKTQVVEHTGNQKYLDCEDFLMYRDVEIVPNDLLCSESLIIIK